MDLETIKASIESGSPKIKRLGNELLELRLRDIQARMKSQIADQRKTEPPIKKVLFPKNQKNDNEKSDDNSSSSRSAASTV